MNNKIIKIVSIFIICMFTLSNSITAVTDIFDTDITTGIYKFSDHEDIKLPFLRFSDSRIIVDKEINKLGMIGSGANIDIDNKLSGSQLILGTDTVRINNEAENLAILANNVVINGTITGNIVINASTVTINEKAVINDDIIIFAETINIKGKVNSNILTYAKNVNIEGNITGDLRCEVENLTFKEESNVEGKIYIKSINDVVIPEKYTNKEIIKLDKYENISTPKIDYINIARISVILALMYLLISTKTKIISNMISNVKKHPILTVFLGFGMIALSIIIMIMLFIITLLGFDMIGIPLMIAYVSFMIITLILSTFVVGSVISEYMYNKFESKLNSKWYKFILAFVIFTMLTLLPYIPVIGGYIPMLLYMVTIGMTLIILKKSN